MKSLTYCQVTPHTKESCHMYTCGITLLYCNTLQHSATLCNTLQHTATYTGGVTLLYATVWMSHVTCTNTSFIHEHVLSHLTESCHIYTRSITLLYCNTLQHSATLCNKLHHTHATFDRVMPYIYMWYHSFVMQHTATHCNTLQHTATHCNTLQHTATLCNKLQHTHANFDRVIQYI